MQTTWRGSARSDSSSSRAGTGAVTVPRNGPRWTTWRRAPGCWWSSCSVSTGSAADRAHAEGGADGERDGPARAMTAPSVGRGWHALLVGLFFLAVTAVYTYPLVLNPRNVLRGWAWRLPDRDQQGDLERA